VSTASQLLPQEVIDQLRRKMAADRERHCDGSFYSVPQQPSPESSPQSPAPPSSSSPASAPGPQIVRKRDSAVEWADYPRIEPGEYAAVSGTTRIYFDKAFQRHVCLIRFAVLKDDKTLLAKLGWFLNLGSADKPRAGRRSEYWRAWIQANGGVPRRNDRLSPRIFERRACRVFVGDTAKNYRSDENFEPYSIIRKVLSWETH
jgi:hypothetical protein